MWDDKRKPGGGHTSGFSVLFGHGGLNHRLITDYLSQSNHLQMRWLITLATIVTSKDRNKSIWDTSLPYQSRRR